MCSSTSRAVSRRQELFDLINELPTCYEVVSGKAKPTPGPPQARKRATDGSAIRPQQRARPVSDAMLHLWWQQPPLLQGHSNRSQLHRAACRLSCGTKGEAGSCCVATHVCLHAGIPHVLSLSSAGPRCSAPASCMYCWHCVCIVARQTGPKTASAW